MTTPRPVRDETPRFGAKVRALRRREGVSQAQLAEKLGISASYLNLIENNRRPLPAPLLIRLAQIYGVDLGTFAADEDARVVSELMEAFADPLFEGHELTSTEVRELATATPAAARAVLSLYRAYQNARGSVETLAERVYEDDEQAKAPYQPPSEDVSDFIQRKMNHFPELETAAEGLWRSAKLDPEELHAGLVRHLEKKHGIHVRIARWEAARGVLRRYEPDKKTLQLSELLPTRARTFQLAHQVALLEHHELLDELVAEAQDLTTDEARGLARVALANYFAAAVLMPYGPFLQAAREERYDIDVIGRRFRVGFEQVCHRLTTLRRPGNEGVPFHMIRIDVAGNISKRFSGSGIRFARFSGACPRWNVFAAFMTPGMIRIQVSRMPDGITYFCLARTIQQDSGGYHAQQPVQAIGLGCQVTYARHLVYSDGVDLDNTAMTINVGVTCRTCERTDCEQRAFPSLRHPLRIDENVRGLSLFSPVEER